LGILGSLVNGLLPLVPRPLVRAVASRYIAGETLEQALKTVRVLNLESTFATLDILGESIPEAEGARAATENYLELIDAVDGETMDSTISIKLTMLGLSIAEELCIKNVERLFERATRAGVFVTIDMEDSTTTSFTLGLFARMRAEYGAAGCVLQAYMKRTLADAKALPPGSNVRLCKGIYVEPAEIAHKGYQEVRDNYVTTLEYLMTAGHYPCIATHDEWLIDEALKLIDKHSLAEDGYEFQMLLGVKPRLRRELVAAGHRMRVYVPYGAEWYPYSVRRLRENPQMAVHVLKAMLGLK
jgi:proline dehydrogenase